MTLARLSDWADRFLFPWDDPGSRLFGLNLLASIALIALFWALKGRNLKREVFRSLFSRHYWWNRSTREDYFLYLLNASLKLFLISPLS